MKFTIYQNSLIGPRKENQDRVAYAYSKDALLLVLADGMGGHHRGEVAAQIAIDVLTESFRHMALPTLPDPAKFLRQHILQIHDVIDQRALLNDMPESPRTTVVVAIVQHGVLHCAHVGDSRLYLLRNGRPLFCTEDHSKVQAMFRKGLIDKEQMQGHHERGLIYNCVGGDKPPQIDLAPKRQLLDGDSLLLCTDGLWSLLDDEEIGDILQHGPVTDTVPVLFRLAESRANTRTGDNMSAIALNWGAGFHSRHSISTASMPQDINTTIIELTSSIDAIEARAQMPKRPPEVSEDDVEQAIAEIQAALAKTSR